MRFGENGGQGGIPHHGTRASSTSKVQWINSYLPTDPGTVSYDDTELDEVLSEIESILTNEIFDDLIWGSDLNWQKGRNTGFAERMERFLNKHDLVTVWDHFTCSHTHIHTDFKSTSLIDHFIVNKRLLQHIDCAPIHLGDNLSRLSPIILKLNVENLPSKSSTNESQSRKFSWQKARIDHKKMYKTNLDEKLKNISIPRCLDCTDVNCQISKHSEERDSFILDIITAMIESSHLNILMTGGFKSTNSRKKKEIIPGFNDLVRPNRETALFWHSIHVSAGRPNKGVLHDIMVKTRNTYHYVIRKVKIQADQIRAKNLLIVVQDGDINLIKEMKKINSKNKGGAILPDAIEGAEGTEEIVEKFKEVYETLFNSSESSAAVQTIKESLKQTIDQNSLSEVSKITDEAR